MKTEHRMYHCNLCQASCTFEAMQFCNTRDDMTAECPTLPLLELGAIVHRRDTDFDPTFPSEFSWATGVNMTKLEQLSGEALRHLRRDWQDKGGYIAVNRGTLAPFHKYIETVTHFTSGEPVVTDESGMVVLDADPVNSLIKNERQYAEVSR